jgi:hypothetical protein
VAEGAGEVANFDHAFFSDHITGKRHLAGIRDRDPRFLVPRRIPYIGDVDDHLKASGIEADRSVKYQFASPYPVRLALEF